MEKPSTLTDRILAIAFVAGLVVLTFLYGSAAGRYQLPLSQSMTNAFVAAESWYTAWKQPNKWEELSPEMLRDARKRDDHIISHPQVTWDKKLAHPGYTLITTGYLTSPYLVDMDGKIVHRWNVAVDKLWPSSICANPLKPADIVADSTHLYPNGDILIAYADATAGAPYGCGIVRADKNGTILWVYNAKVHHDFTVDENGNIYIIMQDTVTSAPDGFEGLSFPVADDIIVKLSPEGKELDRISLLDAFRGSPFELMLYREKYDGDSPPDIFHTNSVAVLNADMAKAFPSFKAGQILVSIRAMSALAVIDPKTRKIVWAYRGFWSYQHSASFLPNGHIMVLDNIGHFESKSKRSRVLEFDPVTLEVKWSFVGNNKVPFLAQRKGRVVYMPNGNILITEFENARAMEITRNHEVAWTYALQKVQRTNRFANAILNTKRYDASSLNFLSY